MAARLDQLLKAAGDHTRLRILSLLQSESICVCELQAVLELPQPTISRHLAALRHAGLVHDRREGNRVVYSLAPAEERTLAALFELIGKCYPADEKLNNKLKEFRRGCRGTSSSTSSENSTAPQPA